MTLNALTPLNDGAIFADFRIVRRLGSGGMGEVYLIQHPRLPRRNALKILSADLSADPEYRTRFNREADLASTLYHPHIVGVHDRGEYNGQLWLSMDFVDGQDAGRLLAHRYPAGMPVDVVVSIITAVASALDYAHRQGLLHRDVKPANIMLTHVDDDGEQRILLTDFGIARSVDDISGLTRTNMSVGTVAYAAPEQLMGEEIDGRADQYALAATAYHLLTGLQLFPHSNPAVAISRHLNAAPPVLADTRPELAALDPVLAAALAKNPDQRFASCSDFARAFADQISPTSLAIPNAPTASAPLPLAGSTPTTWATSGTDRPVDWPAEADAPAEKPLPRRRRSVEYYLFTVLAVISAGLTLAFDIACFFPAFLGEKIDPLPVVLVGTLWGGAWTALCVVVARRSAARPVPRRRRSSVAYCLFVVLAVICGAPLLLVAPVVFSNTDTDWTTVVRMLPFYGGLTALWAWLARRTRVRSVNPDPTTGSAAAQTTEAAPHSESTELRLGGWAGIVGGNRRFIGRVGKIAAIDSNYVVLKWKGSRGKRYFRHIHVVPVATEDPSLVVSDWAAQHRRIRPPDQDRRTPTLHR